MANTANNRVPLRDFLEQRFDALDEKIDAQGKQNNEILKDHEERLRHLERQNPWKWIAQSITGVLAGVGIWLGVK